MEDKSRVLFKADGTPASIKDVCEGASAMFERGVTFDEALESGYFNAVMDLASQSLEFLGGWYETAVIRLAINRHLNKEQQLELARELAPVLCEEELAR